MKNEHLKNLFIILFSFLEILAMNVPKKLRQTNSLHSSGVEAIIICELIPRSLNSLKLKAFKCLDLKKEVYSIEA